MPRGVYPRAPLRERFLQKVERGGLNDCWTWTAGHDHQGYGFFWDGTTTRKAHRIAYELAYGPIPAGMYVLHHCDNPPCVRATHLYLGTHTENARDRVVRGRGAHGERQNFAKLTEESVRRIRDAYANGETQAALARAFEVGESTIWHVVHRKTWVSNG